MRRVLLLLVLLLPSMASAQSFIRYYPPSSGGGGGGTGSGITGCTTPGYNFADDTGAGLCLSAADSLSIQTSASGNSRSYINANTLGIGLNYINSSGETTAFTLLETNATFHFTDATVLNITDALGTGFLVAQGSTAAVAREFTSGDGTVVIVNEDGVSGNPDFTVDTAVVSRFTSGTADASGNCSVGTYHNRTDTNEAWFCTSTNTWTKVRTGTVAVANGGTGLTSGTSGGVLAFTAAGTIASSGALTANLPVIGGGAGVAPTVGTRSGNTTAYVTTTGTQTSGDCVSIDANGNHIASGAACGGSSSFDDTSGTFIDEFLQHSTGTQAIGDLGWGRTAIGTGASNAPYTTAVTNHPGIHRITTSGTDNAGIEFYLMPVGNADLTGEDFDVRYYVRNEDDVTDIYISLGFYTGGLTNTAAIRAVYDTDLSHATWIFQICDSSTSGCQSAGDDTNSDTVASTKAPTAGTWQRVRIRRLTSGVGGNPTYYFSVADGGAAETEKTFCSSGCDEDLGNLPAVPLYPRITAVTRGVANRDVDIDMFYMTVSGLARY